MGDLSIITKEIATCLYLFTEILQPWLAECTGHDFDHDFRQERKTIISEHVVSSNIYYSGHVRVTRWQQACQW